MFKLTSMTYSIRFIAYYIQVIDGGELKSKAKLSFPHTSHCLANGQVMISAMGDVDGNAKGMQLFIM